MASAKTADKGSTKTEAISYQFLSIELTSNAMSSSQRRAKTPKEVESEFIPVEAKQKKRYFAAMTAGMFTSLTALLMIVSLFAPGKRITRAPGAEGDARQVDQLTPEEVFERFLKDSSVGALRLRLEKMKAEAPKNSTERIAINEQRIRIAEAMLGRQSLTRNDRQYAILQQMTARKMNYGVGFLEWKDASSFAVEFQQGFQPWLNDNDEMVRKEARLNQFTFRLFERILGNLPTSEVVATLEGLLKDYPGDQSVEKSIKMQFEACIEQDIETARQLGEELIQSGRAGPSAALYQYMLDRYYAIEKNYDQLFSNRYVNGIVGQRELEKTSIDLLKLRDAGPHLIGTVNRVAAWFEQESKYDVAANIYKAMDDNRENRVIEETEETLRDMAENGLKRLAMIGQPIDLDSHSGSSRETSNVAFRNRVVMILVFDQSKASATALSGFIKLAKRFHDTKAPVRALAVSRSPISDKTWADIPRTDSALRVDNWIDETTPPPILQDFPVSLAPYVLLVDNEGKISHINVAMDELESKIRFLLDAR